MPVHHLLQPGEIGRRPPLSHQPGRGRLQHGADLVDIGKQRAAVLQQQADLAGGHADVGRLHPRATPDAPPHGDGALRLQDAEGLPERGPGDAELLHQHALRRQLIAFLQLAEHDLAAELRRHHLSRLRHPDCRDFGDGIDAHAIEHTRLTSSTA